MAAISRHARRESAQEVEPAWRYLPPSLTRVLTLSEFLEIYDEYEGSSRAASAQADVFEMSPPIADVEEWRPAKEIDKSRAVSDIEYALSAVEAEGPEPDPWEQECLAEAIGTLFRGAYALASVNAKMALTRPEQRSPDARLRDDRSYDLSALRGGFAAAKTEPARQFAHLGPFVVTGAGS